MGRFCSACGDPLHSPPPVVCPHCGTSHWNNARPCGEAIVVRDGRVLLIQRRRDPWRGRWDIPGGFCDGREHPMITAERELKEETGVVGRAVALVGMWLDSYPDDNGT